MLLDGFTVPGSMLAPWAVRRKHEMTTRTSLENMVIFGYFFQACCWIFMGFFEMIRESGIGSREHVWLNSLFLGV